MEATFTNINRPSGIDRDLKLPPALRYFEAEPVRMQEIIYESRDSQGRLHNERNYAVCLDDGTEEWWQHGHAHSVDDWPAIILGQSSEVYLSIPAGLNVPHPDEMLLKPDARVWCDDGLIHRDGNAAVELSPGLFNYQEYWCKGRRHRTDGPAVIKREETWYYHGLIHRHDGPAVVYPDMMKNHYGDWVWYGDLFSTREGLYTQDFPFHEPPAEFYMTAFLSMMSAPELPPHAVDLVVAKIEKLMPDFPVMWQIRELSGWQNIRGEVAICLAQHEQDSSPKPRRKRKARVDSLPLPAGIGDDSYQYAGDVATERKVA